MRQPLFANNCARTTRKVVATNGLFRPASCRASALSGAEARAFGDFLWVGLNGDASVSELKGPGRPLVPEADRAELLAVWRVVDAVTIFPTTLATDFLRAVQPDIYVKGGDYTVASLNPDEAKALRECGAHIEIMHLVPGKSTSSLVEKMAGKVTGEIPRPDFAKILGKAKGRGA